MAKDKQYDATSYPAARAWREAVLARDRRCLACGATGALSAHHVIFRSQCEDAYVRDTRNGIALCADFTPNHCHHALHDARLKIDPSWLPPEVIECLAEQGLRWIDGEPCGPCASYFTNQPREEPCPNQPTGSTSPSASSWATAPRADG